MTPHRLLVLHLGPALLAGLAAVAAAGCGKHARTTLTIVEACQPAHDREVVTVDVYTAVPVMARPCATRCTVDVADTWDYSNDTAQLWLPVGTGPMTMQAIADDGTVLVEPSAFQLVDSDGKRRPVSSHLRITGTIEAKIDGARLCALTPTAIHALPPTT